MQLNRRMAALGAALTMTLVACGGGGVDAAGGIDVDSLDLSGAATAGLAVYQERCAVCHGADLDGGSGPALGLGSPAAAKPMEGLRLKIVEGGNGMPSWSGVLSSGDIDDVLAFLGEAQGR